MRSRFLFAVGITALAVAAWSDPIKYTVLVDKQKVGTLTSETTGDDDSGYIDDTNMSMAQDGKSVNIHEIVHYGKDGIATSRSMEVTGADQDLKVKATLSDDGAKVNSWFGDDKKETEIALATKTTRADPTNFWFKKVTPKVGDSVTYQMFVLNVQELKWADVTLKYVGKVKVKIGDNEVEENEIDRTEGTETSQIYVDEKGDADLIVDGEMRIERQK